MHRSRPRPAHATLLRRLLPEKAEQAPGSQSVCRQLPHQLFLCFRQMSGHRHCHRHFRAQAARGQLAGRLNFCLFLAEMAGQDCFTRLRELALVGEDLCGLALRTGAYSDRKSVV